jgi:predicted transcriptional regulator
MSYYQLEKIHSDSSITRWQIDHFKGKFVEMEIMGAAKGLDQQITERLANLNASQKKVVLSVVKGFTREEENWWNEVEDAAQESIAKGLKQASQGKTTPHKEVMKRYKK